MQNATGKRKPQVTWADLSPREKETALRLAGIRNHALTRQDKIRATAAYLEAGEQRTSQVVVK